MKKIDFDTKITTGLIMFGAAFALHFFIKGDDLIIYMIIIATVILKD